MDRMHVQGASFQSGKLLLRWRFVISFGARLVWRLRLKGALIFVKGRLDLDQEQATEQWPMLDT
jgi:hypothetical protein